MEDTFGGNIWGKFCGLRLGNKSFRAAISSMSKYFDPGMRGPFSKLQKNLEMNMKRSYGLIKV